MSIPLATHTITVLRPSAGAYDEPYAAAPPALADLASGIRAVIDVSTAGVSAGREYAEGGEQTKTLLRLLCDPTDLATLDWIRDEASGIQYRVTWVIHYPGPDDMAHVHAGLELVEGLV